jgi:hypothetical protein
MMSSEEMCRAKTLLDSFLALLDEERIWREIDEPVMRVLAEFEIDDNEPYSTHSFHDAIAKFIQQVGDRGLKARRLLTRDQALAEAITILDDRYFGAGGKGYDAARCVAASFEPNGIRLVVEQLAGLIISRQREKYVERIGQTFIMPPDWQTKRLLAAYLLQVTAASADTPRLAQLPPAQLAPYWQELAKRLADVKAMRGHANLVAGPAAWILKSDDLPSAITE